VTIPSEVRAGRKREGRSKATTAETLSNALGDGRLAPRKRAGDPPERLRFTLAIGGSHSSTQQPRDDRGGPARSGSGLFFGRPYAVAQLFVGLVVFAAVIALSQQHERAFSPAMVYLVLGAAAAGLVRAGGRLARSDPGR
jgi:hypothetical protein